MTKRTHLPLGERIGLIEVGTKGVRLLVAARRPPPEDMAVLKSIGQQGFLGDGLETNGHRMRSAAMKRSAHHVRRFVQIAHALRVHRTILVGTEVCRRATNVGEFQRMLPRGLHLRVLAPEEEAVGSFLSAAWGFRDRLSRDTRLLVIDLGGGSVEVVSGIPGSPPSPQACVSIQHLGTLALRSVWQRHAHPDERERVLQDHLRRSIEPHAATLAAMHAQAAGTPFAAGLGSAVTDSAWALSGRPRKKFSSNGVNGMVVQADALHELRQRLLHESAAAARGHFGIRDIEAHQLGIAALLNVMNGLGIDRLTACGTGLRFGLCYAELHGLRLNIA